MRNRLLLVLLAAFVTCPFLSQASGADWPQFRGPGGRGISAETGVPLTWSAGTNIRWRTELPGPGNNGSPIVAGECVFLTVNQLGEKSNSTIAVSNGQIFLRTWQALYCIE